MPTLSYLYFLLSTSSMFCSPQRQTCSEGAEMTGNDTNLSHMHNMISTTDVVSDVGASTFTHFVLSYQSASADEK